MIDCTLTLQHSTISASFHFFVLQSCAPLHFLCITEKFDLQLLTLQVCRIFMVNGTKTGRGALTKASQPPAGFQCKKASDIQYTHSHLKPPRNSQIPPYISNNSCTPKDEKKLSMQHQFILHNNMQPA